MHRCLEGYLGSNSDGHAEFSRPLLAEMFEHLDQLPETEARDLSFRFGLSDQAAREVLAAWTKTLGLGPIDGRVDEAADWLSIG